MKKILFITGTRADYGKIKPLMKAMNENKMFEVFVFVCGMHLSEKFGSTYNEIEKDHYENIYIAYGLSQTQDASINLGNTITHLSGYVDNIKPDMIIVHGDRMDALAGAVVGALHNIFVGHIEGGELSGTIDESIRHAISKFAHMHFVCTMDAKQRLMQLGEEADRIFIIGSPDIDIMMSNNLPSISSVRQNYEIEFEKYAILMYHPVTTEFNMTAMHTEQVIDAVIQSNRNYIVVYPNNDLGSEIILGKYTKLNKNNHFRVFPSIRFERFLTLLKNAEFIIGNSSAGIRESGIYGIPAIDIGTRQAGRYSRSLKNIQHVNENVSDILMAIDSVDEYRVFSKEFGSGDSANKFMQIVSDENFWKIEIQKKFIDLDF